MAKKYLYPQLLYVPQLRKTMQRSVEPTKPPARLTPMSQPAVVLANHVRESIIHFTEMLQALEWDAYRTAATSILVHMHNHARVGHLSNWAVSQKQLVWGSTVFTYSKWLGDRQTSKYPRPYQNQAIAVWDLIIALARIDGETGVEDAGRYAAEAARQFAGVLKRWLESVQAEKDDEVDHYLLAVYGSVANTAVPATYFGSRILYYLQPQSTAGASQAEFEKWIEVSHVPSPLAHSRRSSSSSILSAISFNSQKRKLSDSSDIRKEEGGKDAKMEEQTTVWKKIVKKVEMVATI